MTKGASAAAARTPAFSVVAFLLSLSPSGDWMGGGGGGAGKVGFEKAVVAYQQTGSRESPTRAWLAV